MEDVPHLDSVQWHPHVEHVECLMQAHPLAALTLHVLVHEFFVIFCGLKLCYAQSHSHDSQVHVSVP